jgi:signal transduction histidine kinase
MIPGSLLNWALVAVSLFNTILLLWLGITLWLNADRRGAGIVLTAAGFLLGSAFFIAQSALLLSPTLQLTRSNTLWVALGTAPVVLLPYVWYVVLLWYNGYWPRRPSTLRRRHRPWLWLVSGVVVFGFVCLMLLGWPYLPVIGRLAALFWPIRELVKASVTRVPIIPAGYALYVLLCVGLSLDSLRHPGLTERILGDAARARARPWLTAATLLLLVVAILVAGAVLWTITNTGLRGNYVLTPNRLEIIGRFDLVLSLLIAGVVVLLGRAMTAYELFTGKVLPRRELARQWGRALALAGGYGVLMGGALVWGLEPVYAVLLTAVMMTTFFALQVWGSYVEWERAMRQLRPFVASQRWYEALVPAISAGEPPPDPFEALCRDLLNTTVAHLVPAGPTAAFVSPRHYPASLQGQPPAPGALPPDVEDAALIVPIDPGRYGGAAWAVSLWREQGLIGVLLLGPRRDGSLYTQEEIEIARSTGERLLDSAASLALSQRLMRLQRERMATTQILDQRTRRVLHDEVLPLIHTAMLSLAAGKPGEVALQPLSDAHGQLSDLLRELPPTVAPEIARLGLLSALRKAVDVEFAPAFSAVTWECGTGVEEDAAGLSPLAAETLYFAAREAVRNAAKHATGQPGAPYLHIAAHTAGGELRVCVEDNGPAIGAGGNDAPAGGHVTQGSTGQGLDLHSTLMAIAGGSLSLETVPGQATRVQLVLPIGGALSATV